ncbi:ABC transporter substrate-binding protein [Elstera sp.]|jgi:branched-chain amino acid transport system substrate-binding protein|uniref:ABC transporter substrate-binding protein n=1 Tax=Elstera sp. TaxID=1916664 RepID=UPI0037BEC439
MSSTQQGVTGLTRRQVLVGTAGLVGAASVIGAPAIAQSTGGPLKIGVLLPRSGILAQAGQSCARAEAIGTTVLKNLGYSVEIIPGDTESNTDTARARAEKLINDGAHVLIGAFDSGQTGAAAQVCEQRGIPLIANIAAAPQLTEQGYKTFFRNFPTSLDLVKNAFPLMKDIFTTTGKTPSKALFLHANDTFGMANKGAFDKLFPDAGMPFSMLDAIAYDPKAQDLSVEVAKAKASGAELLIVTTRAADAILIVREMVKQRFEPMGIISPGSPGLYDEQFYKVLGKYSDYATTILPWYNPRYELSRQVQAEFVKLFPKDKFEGHAFNIGCTLDALLVAADAHKRAGTTAAPALLEALRTTKLETHMMIGPAITFDAKGQNIKFSSAVVQNLDQRPTVVLPNVSAEKAPVFPVPGWQSRG